MSIERLPCKLTEDEKIERAKTATEQLAAYRAKEDQAKSSAATARSELKKIRTEMEESGRAAREGWEYREVSTREHPSGISLTVDTIREDTCEVIRTRPMTEEEVRRWKQPRLVD